MPGGLACDGIARRRLFCLTFGCLFGQLPTCSKCETIARVVVVLKKSRLTFVRPLAWMTGVWLVGAGVFFRNFLLTGFDKIIGDAGDARLDIFLRENLHQFLRGRAEFLSPPMFFPIKGTLGYSDAYLLDGLIYVPLRIMGLDPFLSFELLCIGLSL